MARAKVTHSTDSCMIQFRGDPKNPEPSMGVIKFPGGYVEVSRCSDGSYYAHVCANEGSEIIQSRVDYDHEYARKHGIPDIEDADHITKLAMSIRGEFLEYG